MACSVVRWISISLGNDCGDPRIRQTDDRRVDLVGDLFVHVGFDGGLVDPVVEAPAEDLLRLEVKIWREVYGRRTERSAAVAGAAVGAIGAVATPVGGDDDVGFVAFGRLNEKAFDDPREGGHGGLGGRGCGKQVIDRSVDF